MTANFIINTLLFLQSGERKRILFSPKKKSKNTCKDIVQRMCFRDCHFLKVLDCGFYLSVIGGKTSLILTILKLGQRQGLCKMSPEGLFCLLIFRSMEMLLKAAHFKADGTLVCQGCWVAPTKLGSLQYRYLHSRYKSWSGHCGFSQWTDIECVIQVHLNFLFKQQEKLFLDYLRSEMHSVQIQDPSSIKVWSVSRSQAWCMEGISPKYLE